MNGDTGPPGQKVKWFTPPADAEHVDLTAQTFTMSAVNYLQFVVGECFPQGIPGKPGASGVQGPVGKSVSLTLLYKLHVFYYMGCVVPLTHQTASPKSSMSNPSSNSSHYRVVQEESQVLLFLGLHPMIKKKQQSISAGIIFIRVNESCIPSSSNKGFSFSLYYILI